MQPFSFQSDWRKFCMEMGNKDSSSTTYLYVLKYTNMQTVHNFDMYDKFNAVGICGYCTMNFAEWRSINCYFNG
jgi:hypothetical protein